MAMKRFFKDKWQYICVFAIPWIFIMVHALIRGAWIFSGDSILYGDAGSIYVNLYLDLWESIRNESSTIGIVAFGLEKELLANIFTYLMSPLGILVLMVPKAMVSDMVQVLMVLKWSLLSCAMLYYLNHTKNNLIKDRKILMNIMLAMAYFLSNVVVFSVHNLSALDTMIMFPLLLLLVERALEGKNICGLYISFVISILLNYRLVIPVFIFLLFWMVLQLINETKVSVKYVLNVCVVLILAMISGMMVVVPCLASGVGLSKTPMDSWMTLSEVIQHFFVCDVQWLYQTQQPMLYCSVVVVVLALLYVCTDVSIKKKLITIGILLLLLLGLTTQMGNLIWNGAIRYSVEFSFLLVFLLLYMAMETISHLYSVKIWHGCLVGTIGISAVAYAFYDAIFFLDFYVYLATVLIIVFVMLMLIFFSKKSIQYRNVLIVFACVCVGELFANAYYQLKYYNEYKFEEIYYHTNASDLAVGLDLEVGETIAMNQVMYNYGMALQQPSASQHHSVVGSSVGELYQALGLEWSEDSSAYVGGSPLLNAVFNVQYGMSSSDMAFSDSEQIEDSGDYHLYQMNRLVGLGYMVDSNVSDWRLTPGIPFESQNEFVKYATGEEAVFDLLKPEASCFSILGIDSEYSDEHVHEEGDVCGHVHHDVYAGEYIDETTYYYQFQKMYSDDMVNYSFESDGVSDYYVFVDGTHNSNTYVQIDGAYVYGDQFSSRQKTLHVGVVPKGCQISIISNFEIDNLAISEVRYQVAAFNEANYEKVYESLCHNVLQVASYGKGSVEGEITVDEAGIMLTSIAANKGISVLVDGNTVEWKRIGKALVGVPLSKGTHTVVIEYHVPYLVEGVLLSLLGIVIFVVFYIVWLRNKKKEEVLG